LDSTTEPEVVTLPEQRLGAFDFPRSISQRRAYRLCGMKYLHRYGAGWERRIRKGTYAFGDAWQEAVQAVLKDEVSTPAGMYEAFLAEWDKVAEQDKAGLIEWGSKVGLKFFAERAKGLADVSYRELRRVCGYPGEGARYDESFVYELVPPPTQPERAIPDYVGSALRCEPGGVWSGESVLSVIDWKTSDRDYKVIETELDDQLTNYQLGSERHYGQRIEQVGLCVFVYQAMPRVQWIMCPRRPEETVQQFVAAAVVDDQRIRRGEFPRNPAACFARGECEYVPLCYPSQAGRIVQELVKPEQPRNPQSLEWLELEAIED
jgi:hypothetical protein